MKYNYIQTIKELRQLDELKEKVNQEIKSKQEILKHIMIEQGVSELYGDEGEKVCYSEYETSRFQTALFRRHFENIYQNYVKTTRNYRFTLTY